MTIKEQENQLELNLKVEIVASVVIWLGVCFFVGYKLWTLRSLPEAPLAIGINVPTIKQVNLDILRASLKIVSESNLPVVRTEPFD
jgi:hypothetical protein